MRLAIFAVLIAVSACFAKVHEKRQIGFGGLPFYGGGFYGGGFYPGYYAGGVGVLPGAAILGRKRREAVDEEADVEHHEDKEKRHLYPGYGWGYPGFGYPGFGYPGYGYPGFGYPGFGYPFPGFIRKRREAEHHEEDDEHKEKRQIYPGYGGVGYGAGYGVGYGGYGLGGYGGVGYPGGYGGYGLGGYGAGFVGRKRRDTADVEHHDSKEKRQIFPGYGGLGYGGYGGLGYGGYGLGYGGAGYPGVYGGYGAGFIGRKRRDTEDVESHKDKRQVLLGGVGYPGYGYGGLGYGGGYGYGLGLGAVNTGFGYPAIYGRKRRSTDEQHKHQEHSEHHDHDEHHSKEKRQILGGYGLGYGGFGYGGYGGVGYPGYGGLGYGAVNTGFGYPAIYGRKRRHADKF